MSTRVCVFCGKPPSQKSREHVLPQWLLGLTGSPSRKAFLGREWARPDIRQRVYSFDSFTFPACEPCNTAFSDLESEAKRVVMALLELRPVSCADLVVLLDWLDKVRVGVWLGFLYLNRQIDAVDPQFHIGSRIGTADRLVVIYRSEEKFEGIGLGGTESPIFRAMPSCFNLCINHLHFVSASAPMLFSERFGLPHAVDRRLVKDREGFVADIAPGRGSPSFPLIPFRIAPGGTAVYQPIIPRQDSRGDYAALYDNDFVRASCADDASGRGHVFMVDGEKLIRYPPTAVPLWIPAPLTQLEAFSETSLMSGEWLDAMYADVPSTADLTPQQAEFIRDSVASTRALHALMMEHLRNQIASAKFVYRPLG